MTKVALSGAGGIVGSILRKGLRERGIAAIFRRARCGLGGQPLGVHRAALAFAVPKARRIGLASEKRRWWVTPS